MDYFIENFMENYYSIFLAKSTLETMQALLPDHYSKYSKRTFTQPQLMAVLCLMRIEGWTYRETEIRLAERPDLFDVLGLKRVPDHTTLYRFMRRIDDERLFKLLDDLVTHPRPRRRGRKQRNAAAVISNRPAPTSSGAVFITPERSNSSLLD